MFLSVLYYRKKQNLKIVQSKLVINVLHSAHLVLLWIGLSPQCLKHGLVFLVSYVDDWRSRSFCVPLVTVSGDMQVTKLVKGNSVHFLDAPMDLY